jgi:hypothetical protein
MILTVAPLSIEESVSLTSRSVSITVGCAGLNSVDVEVVPTAGASLIGVTLIVTVVSVAWLPASTARMVTMVLPKASCAESRRN